LRDHFSRRHDLAVTLQSEARKIVLRATHGHTAAGAESRVEGTSGVITCIRLTSTGGLDPTFGSQGKASTQILTATTGVYVQSTARIIVGRTGGDSGASRYALDAFTGTGTSDTNFGSNGEALAAVTGTIDAVVKAIVLQPDGKIIFNEILIKFSFFR
jgi:hypothetical protein